MRYVGGKHRLARDIVSHFPLDLAQRTHIEPFVGSGAVIAQVKARQRIANDAHPYLIALLSSLQSGYVPPDTLSLENYLAIKAHPEGYDPALVGFAGFACSFGAKWFGGYARDGKINGRNYAAEGQRNLHKLAPLLQGIDWYCLDYQRVPIPQDESCVIYCDPPYHGTQGYSGTHEDYFDSDAFFQWCRQQAKVHDVFVSEFTASSDFLCLWSKTRAASLDRNTGGKVSTEKLFWIGPA